MWKRVGPCGDCLVRFGQSKKGFINRATDPAARLRAAAYSATQERPLPRRLPLLRRLLLRRLLMRRPSLLKRMLLRRLLPRRVLPRRLLLRRLLPRRLMPTH